MQCGNSAYLNIRLSSKYLLISCTYLCYGSKVWGYEYQRKIEQVHINFCKSVLGVGKYASNSAVLRERGRLPMATRYYIRFIKYWLKILKMDHDSFSAQCYDEMCKTDKLGTANWVTKVKEHCLVMVMVVFGSPSPWVMKHNF